MTFLSLKMEIKKSSMANVFKVDGQLVDELKLSYSKAGHSFHDYDDFLSSWSRIAGDQVCDDKEASSDYSSIERFAMDALSGLVQNDGADSEEYIGSPLFNSLQNSAIICDEAGRVSLSNKLAMQRHEINTGMSLDTLDLVVDTGQRLVEKVKQMTSMKPSQEGLSLMHCHRTGTDSLFPIAVMRLGSADVNTSQALIIFLDAACSEETLALMASKFGLTSAEADVVSAFSSGKSLKEIAADKHRSYATIRNQFQSVLEKTGCPNQGDLLRMLLGVSYLLSYAALATVNEDKPLGRKVEVMRPHGRFVEVMLYGDTSGKPFIVLPSLFGMLVTPDVEKKLHERSLFMIGIWRPGFAGTSCPPKELSTYECLADDVRTVLDNLGIDQCPVLARASAARSAFKLAGLVPERISNVFIANSMVPRRFVEQNTIKSRWASALVLASRFSPSLAVLILETGQKLMLRHGAEHFCKKMYSGSNVDERLLADQVIVNCIFEGAKLATAPGMDTSAQDILEGFEDWSSEVLTVQNKVTLLQGGSDPHISIEASRAFAAEFPNHVELVEFPDGGGLLSYTHTDAILNFIEASCLAHNK